MVNTEIFRFSRWSAIIVACVDHSTGEDAQAIPANAPHGLWTSLSMKRASKKIEIVAAPSHFSLRYRSFDEVGGTKNGAQH